MSVTLSIKLLTNHQIDKKRWDETIESAQNGIVYGYSWYLDAVFPNWTALVSEDYTYIFPITSNRKFGLSYWYSPIYTMQLGLFSSQVITNSIIQQFYNHLPKNIISYDFSVNTQIQIFPPNFTYKVQTCQYVDLSNSYNEIKLGYSSNLKRNLKKAQRANLFITESKDVSSVVRLFRENRGEKLNNIRESDYLILDTLIRKCLSTKSGKIFQVYSDNELVASCFFSFTNKRIIYHKGGVNENGKHCGAMHFLLDQLIQKYALTNWKLDFGGSSIPTVKRFNENFGGKEYTYLQLSKGNKWIGIGRNLKNSLLKRK